MANIIISSSCAKTLTPITTKPSSSPPLPSKPHHHHHISITNIKNKVLGSIRLVAALAAVADAAAAAKPSVAMAKEMEKAALFDFNLTLPSIAAEFLLLMVAQDKIYFTPLAEGRKKMEAEFAETLQNLEMQKEETIKARDSQIAALSD
ncbi:hypothetical protein AAC387_Pa01g4106 [Persea americana]